MLLTQRLRRVRGTARIEKALDMFEIVKAELEDGISEVNQELVSNEAARQALEVRANALKETVARAARIKGRFAELLK